VHSDDANANAPSRLARLAEVWEKDQSRRARHRRIQSRAKAAVFSVFGLLAEATLGAPLVAIPTIWFEQCKEFVVAAAKKKLSRSEREEGSQAARTRAAKASGAKKRAKKSSTREAGRENCEKGRKNLRGKGRLRKGPQELSQEACAEDEIEEAVSLKQTSVPEKSLNRDRRGHQQVRCRAKPVPARENIFYITTAIAYPNGRAAYRHAL